MVLMNFPLLVFALSFVVLLLAALFGDTIRTKVHALKGGEQDDFDVVLSATLTLLGLLIGFSFSMAISRYDQRKNYEEAEANAIGTEYVRADFLPADDAAKVRNLLIRYLDERVLFYTTRDDSQLAKTWWNRIPVAAWGMMAVIAVSCNLLIGYGAHGRDWRTLLIVPIVVSIAFLLISDIDSPRGGAIRVAPHNLISLSKSLRSQ